MSPVRFTRRTLLGAALACPAVGAAAPPERGNVARVGTIPHFGQGTSWAVGGPMLAQLGIRHIRDYCPPAPLPPDSAYAMLPRAGIRLCAVVAPNVPVAESIRRLEAYERAYPGTLDAIEGPNEVNNFHVATLPNGRSDIPAALGLQSQLYTAVKASRVLAHLPVVHCTGAPMTAACDRFNQHVYVHPFGGDDMRRHLFGAPATPALHALSVGVFTQYANAARRAVPPFAPKPLWITETGYSTAKCSADQQAEFLLRDLRQAIDAGVERIYVYELADGAPEGKPAGAMGLFTRNGTPKPVAMALKSFLAS